MIKEKLSVLIFLLSSVILKSNARFASMGSSTTRVYLWSLGVTAISANPFVGYGLGNQTDAMFKNESAFNFLDINEYNSVDTFHKQSVHQYLLDGMLSFGIFYTIPFCLLFMDFFKKINLLINKLNSKSSFYFAVKLSVVGLFIFCLVNVMQQHYFFLGFYGLLNKRNLNHIE